MCMLIVDKLKCLLILSLCIYCNDCFNIKLVGYRVFYFSNRVYIYWLNSIYNIYSIYSVNIKNIIFCFCGFKLQDKGEMLLRLLWSVWMEKHSRSLASVSDRAILLYAR